MTMLQETREIKEWLLTRKPHLSDIDPDTDLLREQIVDSLEFVELMFTVQTVYGVSIDTSEVDVDTLRSLRTIELHYGKH